MTRFPRPGGWHLLPASIVGLLCSLAAAQAPVEAAPKRLGVFFWHDSPNDLATFAGIQKGLRQSGMPHSFVEVRADSDPAKAKLAFAQLRDAHCDLVFAMGTQAALLAKTELTGIPVVFAAVSDPVASGIVPSWDGSGTNLCGASNWIAPQNVLSVFRLAVPGMRRLGVLRSQASGLVSAAELTTMRAHLATLPKHPIELLEEVAKDPADLPAATARLLAANVDAIWIPIDITVYQNVPAIRKELGAAKIPLLTTAAAGLRAGALVGAVVDYPLHGRRTALLAIDVLLHGKNPGSLPIDRMQGSRITVNLAIARENGIQLPLSLLVLADELLDPDFPNAPR
jgi:putative tryptophan/tyrosine transport system substrate-binding protein